MRGNMKGTRQKGKTVYVCVGLGMGMQDNAQQPGSGVGSTQLVLDRGF